MTTGNWLLTRLSGARALMTFNATMGFSAMEPSSIFVMCSKIEIRVNYTESAGNDAPYATNMQVHAAKDFTLDNLSGTWTYNDNETDGEGAHSYNWYEGETFAGPYRSLGVNSTWLDSNYTNESSYYIFGVTPRASAGTENTDEYNSSAFQ